MGLSHVTDQDVVPVGAVSPRGKPEDRRQPSHERHIGESTHVLLPGLGFSHPEFLPLSGGVFLDRTGRQLREDAEGVWDEDAITCVQPMLAKLDPMWALSAIFKFQGETVSVGGGLECLATQGLVLWGNKT